MDQEILALKRELGKYKEYGVTSTVFDVTVAIRTITDKSIISEKIGHIYYSDCGEQDIPELIKRDLKNTQHQVNNVQKIKLGTLIIK